MPMHGRGVLARSATCEGCLDIDVIIYDLPLLILHTEVKISVANRPMVYQPYDGLCVLGCKSIVDLELLLLRVMHAAEIRIRGMVPAVSNQGLGSSSLSSTVSLGSRGKRAHFLEQCSTRESSSASGVIPPRASPTGAA